LSAGIFDPLEHRRPPLLQVAAYAFACLLILGIANSAKSDDDAAPAPASLYLAHCANCHGATLAGGQFGPSLMGIASSPKWSGKRAELFAFIKENMPPSDPGSLSDARYWAVTDYVMNPGEQSAALPASIAASESRARAVAQEARHFGPRRAKPGVFADQTARQFWADQKTQLENLTLVTDTMLVNPPPDDWLIWRRTYETTSFSPLHAIDRVNAKRLTSIWSWSLPISVNEIAPLVHDGIMFINSANRVQALDAANGTLLWQYTRELAPQFSGPLNLMQRNFAIYGGNLYLATGDLHVIALDAKTGKLVWDHEVVAPGNPGVMLSAGPLAVRGKIVQGVSGGLACKGGCYVVGLDAGSGRQIWRFDTTAKPGSPGGETWNDTPAADRLGAAVWVTPSYDPKANLVYFGTGQTYHLYTLLTRRDGKPSRNNAGLYTDSTIALNPDNGQLAWYHQHLPRDVWDLDESFERALITLPLQGRDHDLVVAVGKLGILDALERRSGAYAFSIDLGLQRVVKSIDPKTGSRTVDSNAVPKPFETIEICPGAEGARNWMSTAYDPTHRRMFLPMMDICMDMVWQPNSGGATSFERADIGWSLKPSPNTDGKYGRLVGIDLLTRKVVWVKRFRAPVTSSLLLTAGGLLFEGDRDRYFRALDEETGETLWATRLNAAPNSSPITYRVGEHQYVAVVAGGGGPHDADIQEVTPEITNSTPSTTLWVFSLPQDWP
jgi:alcohol dehydrogenase (cytochrome c)